MIVLGVRGKIDPLSGMVLNLIEVDRVAQFLLEKIELENFVSRSVALEVLVGLWRRALGEWGAELARVEIREARHRCEWQNDERGPLFWVGRFHEVSEDQPLGFIEVGYRNEVDEKKLRGLLRELASRSLEEGVQRLGQEGSVREILFREWKTQRTIRWTY